jgi:glycerol-3-phosphate O-acyltransferase
MLIGPARTKVVVGEEIKLHEFAAGDRESPETVARKVRLSVRVFLAREERAVLGPRLVPRRRLLDRALRDPSLRQTLRSFSDDTGRSMDDVENEVRRNLDEIAADYNWTAIRLFELALSKVWTRIYEDFQIDLDGLERVRELTKSGPLILVPTHKSHMDYLILSYLFKMNEIPPPHIAAGINLSFFPVGQLFRRCGAFFIRRSFLGDRLYEAAMRTYIRSLLRERYNLEFFIEGTRSRSGKIMPPKFGMLSMAVEALEGFSENCHIVPVAIDYESLVEEASIVKEAAGGEKSKESVGGLLRARKTLGRRYGSVYVRFAEEIDARQALANLRNEGHTGHAAVRRLAYEVLGGMERAVTVTATSLVATAIVVHHKRGIREETLRARVRLLQDAVRRSGAQLSSEFLYGQQLDTDRALELLLGSRALKVIELQGERVYTVDDEYRMTLDYYKNNTVHFLVDLSFAALAFRLRREDTLDSLWDGYSLLHALFLEEFHRVYTPPQRDELRAVLDWLVERRFIEEHDGLWRVLEPAEMMAFENVTRNFLESAFIAVVALLEGHGDGTPRGMADWLRHTMEIGDLLYARGDIWRSESRSKVNLQNALNSHRHSGLLVEVPNEGGGRRRRTVWVLAEEAPAALGRMRDDLQRILGEVQLN